MELFFIDEIIIFTEYLRFPFPINNHSFRRTKILILRVQKLWNMRDYSTFFSDATWLEANPSPWQVSQRKKIIIIGCIINAIEIWHKLEWPILVSNWSF